MIQEKNGRRKFPRASLPFNGQSSGVFVLPRYIVSASRLFTFTWCFIALLQRQFPTEFTRVLHRQKQGPRAKGIRSGGVSQLDGFDQGPVRCAPLNFPGTFYLLIVIFCLIPTSSPTPQRIRQHSTIFKTAWEKWT